MPPPAPPPPHNIPMQSKGPKQLIKTRVIGPAAPSKGTKMKSIVSQKPIQETRSIKGSTKYSKGPPMKLTAVKQFYHSEGSAAAKSMAQEVTEKMNGEDDDDELLLFDVSETRNQFSKSKVATLGGGGGGGSLFDTGDTTGGKTETVSKIELERTKNRKKRVFFKKKK